MIDKTFKYTGEAKDYGGTEAFHYEGQNWIIAVHSKSFNIAPNLIQGSIEDLNGNAFDFSLRHGGYVSYARILDSMYDGLGTRYDETDRVISKYVISKIKSIAEEYLSGTSAFQVKK